MIRLFISDIDGCLATPYTPLHLDRVAELRLMVESGGLPGSNSSLPAFSVCSGRAYPYVEAISQVFGVRTPVLFESGAGLFDPDSAQSKWHPDVTDELLDDMQTIKSVFRGLVSGTPISVDMAKETQASVVAPEFRHIEPILPAIQEYLSAHFPKLEFFVTPYSIDVVAPFLTKRSGVLWLASECGLELSQIAFMGDTEGDLGALAAVGRSYAPANAAESVRQRVDLATEAAEIAGVIEAFRDATVFRS